MDRDSTRYDDKVAALFRERMIDWQFRQTSLAEDLDFYRQLQRVQAAIYSLDEYLELTWDLDPECLSRFWEDIDASLRAFGLTHAERSDLLAEIRAYQRQEERMHVTSQPVPAPLGIFYYYKTCDVRLHRRLIQRFDRMPEDGPPLTGWLTFDLITEIEDDLIDLAEDEGTYNVNRLLHAIKSDSLNEARQEYLTFVDNLMAEPLPSMLPPAVADTLQSATRAAAERVRQRLNQLTMSAEPQALTDQQP